MGWFGGASGLDEMQDFRLVFKPGLAFLRLTGNKGMETNVEATSVLLRIGVSLEALKLLAALGLQACTASIQTSPEQSKANLLRLLINTEPCGW